MLYQAFQTHADLMWPPRTAASGALPALKEAQGARYCRCGPLPRSRCSRSPT
jgi:hypothetical protein